MKFSHNASWLYKYPSDVFTVTYDFTSYTGASTLASCTASSYNSENINKTASMISNATISTTNIVFLLSNGKGGETYNIKLTGKVSSNKKYTSYLVCEVFNSLVLNTKLGDMKQNSYVTLKEANDYIRNKYGHVNAWDSLNDEGRKRILIEAANDMEVYNYTGEKYYENQGLQFPRNTHNIITGNCSTPITNTSFRNTKLYSTTYNKYPTDYWKYGTIHITTGSAIRDTRNIDKSNVINGSITVASAFTATPSSSDSFVIFAPLDKELKDAQCEQTLYLISNTGIGDLQNYIQLGARRVAIGDVSVDFGSGGSKGVTVSSKAKALLSRFLRKGIRVARA